MLRTNSMKPCRTIQTGLIISSANFFIASHHYLYLNGSDSRLYLVYQWESGLIHYPVN